MDELKKNLHLVVFAAGVLLGVILLLVGMTVRGGAVDQLDERQAALDSAINPPTQGDLQQAEADRARFDSSLEEAEKTLTAASRLLNDVNPSMTASAFKNQYPPRLQALKQRYEQLAEIQDAAQLPEPISDYKLEPPTGGARGDYFDGVGTRMGNASQVQVESYLIELNIMEEVATTCERLVDAGVDGGKGVKLIDFSFQEFDRGTGGRTQGQNPWRTMNWEVRFQCIPSFSLMLMEELVSPTELTAGEEGRLAFPNILRTFAVQVGRRPHVAGFEIDGDAKEARDQPRDLDPDSPEGQQLIEQFRTELEQLPVILPVRTELKLTAAAFNKEWRPLQPETPGNP